MRCSRKLSLRAGASISVHVFSPTCTHHSLTSRSKHRKLLSPHAFPWWPPYATEYPTLYGARPAASRWSYPAHPCPPPSSTHLHFTLSIRTEALGLYSNTSDTKFN